MPNQLKKTLRRNPSYMDLFAQTKKEIQRDARAIRAEFPLTDTYYLNPAGVDRVVEHIRQGLCLWEAAVSQDVLRFTVRSVLDDEKALHAFTQARADLLVDFIVPQKPRPSFLEAHAIQCSAIRAGEKGEARKRELFFIDNMKGKNQ